MNLQKLQRKAIHRRCRCGCGRIVNLGRRWINGHQNIGNTNALGYKHTKEAKEKMSLTHEGVKLSEETKRNMSLAREGMKYSKETKIKMALAKIKDNPDYQYCGAWQDREYRRDLLKDHCEGEECKGTYKKLNNHHIDLNKKHCHPSNVMTLCVPCSMTLHNRLNSIVGRKGTNHKDYLTINRPDHITYVLKGTRKTWALRRVIK